MQFALLYADPESRSLADAALAAGHVLAWQAEPDGADPHAWEALVDPAAADFVIVGAGHSDPPAAGQLGPDQRARQVQELVKLGRPLLTVHPLTPSVISYFEIDMARGETGAVLMHFNPLLESDLVATAGEWILSGSPTLGAVEQIVAIRALADRSQGSVERHFARDVELLARLAGRLDRIGAHAAVSDPNTAYGSLGVQLLGARPLPVRWAVEPPAGRQELRVALVCNAGRATLVFDDRDCCAELMEQGPAGERRLGAAGPAPAAASLARFAAAVQSGSGAASTWTSALDAMELTDSIEISLRRGRVIDVHRRELTEELAFKGMMSAVGCGVLVVLVPLMLAAGWIAGLVRLPLSEYWPHLLLAMLAAFLALQVVPKLILPAEARRGGRETGRGDPAGRAPDDSAD